MLLVLQDIELEDLMSFATASGEHGDDFTKASSHLFDVTISSLVSSIRRKEKASERIALLARVMDRTRRNSKYGDAHQLVLHAALTLAESNAEAADVILANVTKQERWLLPQLDRSNLTATIRQVRRLRSNIRAEQLRKKSLGNQDRDEDGSSSLAEGAIELLLSVIEDVNGGSFDADANKMCVELLDLLREVQGTNALIRAADTFPIYLEAALSSSTAVDVYAATSLFVDLASSSPIQVYDAALSNLVGTLVADSEEDSKRKKGTLQTCALLLCNGPEGTLTMAQRHFGTFISAVASIIVASMRRGDHDVVYHSIQSIEAVVAGRVSVRRQSDEARILADKTLPDLAPSLSGYGRPSGSDELPLLFFFPILRCRSCGAGRSHKRSSHCQIHHLHALNYRATSTRSGLAPRCAAHHRPRTARGPLQVTASRCVRYWRSSAPSDPSSPATSSNMA